MVCVFAIYGRQEERLANKSDLARTALCSYEKGRRSTTSINYALFLRNEYEISLDWIYFGDEIIVPNHVGRSRSPKKRTFKYSQYRIF
ncbi:hypothetical protein [Candidatus Liberibacter sp.]|uniref:hypothetical protein n=1 Tax=Candidatus Liberibacter sp. TaxID=34022 RepID=UPI0015F440B5|nr:hypothetical protein [Candidatus Liberibacter sp.]MBA5724424.1 hypothetical protein [Candidatus Liberibacter sp.]